MDGEQRDVLAAIATRRSVRSYLPVRLGRETVQRLLAAAVRAPTAIHEEQWAFVVLQGAASLKALSAQIYPAGDSNLFHGADTLVLICTPPMGPYVVADCWLASANLMLAAHALGLGSCVIGSAIEGLNRPEVKLQLGVPADMNVVVPLVLGVPREQGMPTPRKPPQVLSWQENT